MRRATALSEQSQRKAGDLCDGTSSGRIASACRSDQALQPTGFAGG